MNRKSVSEFDTFKESLEQEKTLEGKIEGSLKEMESLLAKSEGPDFRMFWDLRAFCLELFKGEMPRAVRKQYWERYVALTQEFRQVKKVLEEGSQFAQEQMELAITALEEEVAQQQWCEEKPTMVRLKEELETLNLFIERLTVLRKELIESQELIWVRHKGKLFRRLSKLGDQLFALRKEKMETMARLYEEAVDNFVSTNFPSNAPKGPYKNLIREIQRLQAMSRVLMHSEVYRRTRLKLSACWDRIKESEKEKKAEDEQNRVKYAENLAPFLEKVETLDKEFHEGKKDVAACHEEMRKIERESQSKELGFREKKELKQRLFQMKRVIDQRLEKEREAAQKQHQLNEEKRKEIFDKFCQKIEAVIQKGEQLDQQKEGLEQEIETLKLTKTEKLFVQRLMNQLKEKIISQHEAALLQLPDDQKQALEQLKTLLEEKQEWRQQIKSEVDALKKLNSGSGLDFEKAIEIRQLLDEEEHKLITIDEAIADIEQRISTIKQNHR